MRVYVDGDRKVIDFRASGTAIYNDPPPEGTDRIMEIDEASNQQLVALLGASADSLDQFRAADDGVEWNGAKIPIAAPHPATIAHNELTAAVGALMDDQTQVSARQVRLILREMARRLGLESPEG